MAITRRDFLSGVAIASTGASAIPALSSATPAGRGPLEYYPPGLSGLRGSHPGSFEASHAHAFGNGVVNPVTAIDETAYDLIVVGGGISGLAAAYFWRKSHGTSSKILIVDNHDDFGGHAKRNEFQIEGRTLIGYGGSQSIEAPSHFSDVAMGLLTELGVEPQRFYDYYDQDFPERNTLGGRWFFDSKHFGKDVLTENPLGVPWLGVDTDGDVAAMIAEMPLSETGRTSLLTLLTSKRDWLAGKTVEEKVEYLRSKSYEAFLREDVSASEEVILLLRSRAHGLWAVGYDALSALTAAKAAEPGTTNLGLEEWLWGDADEDEPYIFHFPDGNASIARLLVRSLIPSVLPGATMEDIVTATCDYSALDQQANPVKLRLNSTALQVQQTGGGKDESVDVIYQVGNRTVRARGGHAIMACYNHVIPHICPDLPDAQAEAMAWPEKAPLVYTNVALRNWRAFQAAGLYHFAAPRDFWVYGALDFPVSMPGYRYTENPDEPVVLHMVHVPTAAGKPMRDQYREGRRKLLSLTLEDYERALRRQLTAMLGDFGFAFDRDVAGITVNRWPHGYAYEYNDLYDPVDWGPDSGPHILARKPFGRIGVANSDSSAYAYVNGAIDAAYRAVSELQSGQL